MANRIIQKKAKITVTRQHKKGVRL